MTLLIQPIQRVRVRPSRPLFSTPAFAALGLLLFLAAATALTPRSAQAQQIVAPNSLTEAEGNAGVGFPFISSGRFQLVYNASQFSGLSAPSLVTQIAFRPRAAFGETYSRTLSSLILRLSTTAAAEGTLSTVYADNLGSNTATVFNDGITLSSAFISLAPGPAPFDLVINLSTPFLYDPTAGNLLIDLSVVGGEGQGILDGSTLTGDGTGWVFNNSGDPNETVGRADTVGLATRFTFAQNTAAPEPGSLALLLPILPVLGTVGMVIRRKRKVSAN